MNAPPLPLAAGDVVRLRRAHPCGGRDWRVTRVGADVGLECATCGRRVLLSREELERRCIRAASPEAGDGRGA